MARIDIRNAGEEIDCIIFAETKQNYHTATELRHPAPGVCMISDSCTATRMLGIYSEVDARNMIRALQKAIDLGWFNK